MTTTKQNDSNSITAMNLEKIQKQLEEVTKERDSLKSQIRERDGREAIIADIRAMGATADKADCLYYLLKGQNRIRYDNDSDSMVGYINPDLNSSCPIDVLLRTAKVEKPEYFTQTKTETSSKPLRNPFAAETFNLTEQTRMMRETPAIASRLREIANN